MCSICFGVFYASGFLRLYVILILSSPFLLCANSFAISTEALRELEMLTRDLTEMGLAEDTPSPGPGADCGLATSEVTQEDLDRYGQGPELGTTYISCSPNSQCLTRSGNLQLASKR